MERLSQQCFNCFIPIHRIHRCLNWQSRRGKISGSSSSSGGGGGGEGSGKIV